MNNRKDLGKRERKISKSKSIGANSAAKKKVTILIDDDVGMLVVDVPKGDNNLIEDNSNSVSQEMDGLDFSSNKAKVKKHDSSPSVTSSEMISPRLKLSQSTSNVVKPASLDSYIMKTEKIHNSSLEKKIIRLSDNKEEKTPHDKEKTSHDKEKTSHDKEKTHLDKNNTLMFEKGIHNLSEKSTKKHIDKDKGEKESVEKNS